jgi:hypothetical protein
MADWPDSVEQWGAQTFSISPRHPWSLGSAIMGAVITVPASLAWQTANRAIFVPFRVPGQVTAFKMVVGNGAVSTSNFSAGIYDEWGNRLVVSANTAHVTSQEVVLDIADTTFGPGLFYMALSNDNNTGTFIGGAAAQTALVKAIGIFTMETAYPLPNPATFATAAGTYIPQLSILLRAN